MPTKNPRVNITIDQSTANILSTLALKECKSIAALSKELMLDALELREDMYLSDLAQRREQIDLDKSKLNHHDAWK